MSVPFTSALNVIVGTNWFQAILTIILLASYIFFLGTNNLPGAEQLKSWVDLVIGFWVAKVGTGLAVAQQVTQQAVKSGK